MGTALSLALVAPLVDAGEPASSGSHPRTAASAAPAPPSASAAVVHLRPDSTLQDLLEHPALTGFADHTLPGSGREPDRRMRLREIDALLPYHSHVDPTATVAGLNRLIDDATAGRRVFYDIYSASQRQADPTKANTGLFFLRGQPDAPFAVISPGGGFAYVGSVHEGFPYAQAINRQGYNAFVLQYRVGLGGRAATEDLAAALAYIFDHARELGVRPDGYSVWGSSAGARMAAAIGTDGIAAYGAATVTGKPLPPAAVVMAYTGHTAFSAQDPPTFAVVGAEDGIASPTVMMQRVAALRAGGVTVAFHRYPNVGHGFGLGTGTSAEGWIEEAIRFWERATAR